MSEGMEGNKEETAVQEVSIPRPPPLTDFIPEKQSTSGSTDPLERTPLTESTTDPTDFDKLWSYLSTLNLTKLRGVCKKVKASQQGKKEDLVRRVFYKVKGTSLLEGETEFHAAFVQWLASNNGKMRWKVAPTVRTCTVEDEDVTSPSSFMLQDFARLVLLLAQNTDVRKALLDSGKERTREELDLRIPRDAFWSNVVAPKFNDQNVKVSFLFGDELRNVSSAYVPKIQRSGDELKRQYNAMRSHFTTSYDRWSRSGQNDPTNFSEFCGTNAIGKKCLVLFAVLGCDKKEETSELLDFVLRTIPVTAANDSGQEQPRLEDSKDARRKRKRDVTESLHESLKEFKEVFSKHRNAQDTSRVLNARTALYKQLHELLDMRRSLGNNEGSIREFLNKELEKVQEKISELE